MSREAAVEQLAIELTGFMGTNVKKIYNYLPNTFDGQSPTIALYAGGSKRPGSSRRFSKQHRVFIYIAVVYAIEGSTSLTEATAQKTLNRISDLLDSFIESNRTLPGYWSMLNFMDEFSEVTPVNMGSQPYFVEIVPALLTEY